MRFLPILLVAAAASGMASTQAEARDGCGRGFYNNGYRCVEQPGPYEREYIPAPHHYEGRPAYRGGYDDGPRGGGDARCPNGGVYTWRPGTGQGCYGAGGGAGSGGDARCPGGGVYTWRPGTGTGCYRR